MTGLFIVFEGGEGAGKSTQAALLAAACRRLGREVVATREPGDTPVGARLRTLLLDPDTTIDPRTEALLYAADRAQHVAEVIRPALTRGAVVVSDRYVASSLAYQAGGRRLAGADVEALSRFATGDLRPDRTVLLDIDPREGLRRAGRAGTLDRLEAEEVPFHDLVRQRFLELAGEAGDSWLVLDASDPPETLHRRVAEWLHLPQPVRAP